MLFLVVCLLVLGALGPVVHGTVKAAASGGVTKNAVLGLRTPSTMASDAAWVAAHESGLPITRVVFVTVPAVALVGLLLTVAPVNDAYPSAAALVCAGILGTLTVVAGIRGHLAAKKVLKVDQPN